MPVPNIVLPAALALGGEDCAPFDMHDPRLGVSAPYKMCLYPQNDIISSTIRKDGVWEPHVLAAFRAIMKLAPSSPANILDVGGNIGFFTLVAAAHGQRVWTVEATRRNSQQIMNSLRLNGFEDRVCTRMLGMLCRFECNVVYVY
jgi:hypothetical protein